jgi:hypothetical protein
VAAPAETRSKPVQRRALVRRLRDEHRVVRRLEALLEQARTRRADLARKLAGVGVSETSLAGVCAVSRGRVNDWKRFGTARAASAPAPTPSTPLTPGQYYLLWQLLGEPLAAVELRGSTPGSTIQGRVNELRSLLARGWVERSNGIYYATKRARRAVSW